MDNMQEAVHPIINSEAFERAVEAAVQKALAKIDTWKTCASPDTRREHLRHNVKLLLSKYRYLKASHANAVYDLVTMTDKQLGELEPDEELEEIRDLMRNTISRHDVHVESVERTAARTHLLLEDIDAALADYKLKCEAGSESDQRRWRVLDARYLADSTKTTAQIAEDENCDMRTIQRDLQKAIEDMTVVLFGSEGLLDIA